MKSSKVQEEKFLSVCSPHDYDILTDKAEMTQEDFARLTYITLSLGYNEYTQLIISKHLDLARIEEERSDREHEIYLEYPEYYEDEGIFDKTEKWLEDFVNQLPNEKQEEFRQLIKYNQIY